MLALAKGVKNDRRRSVRKLPVISKNFAIFQRSQVFVESAGNLIVRFKPSDGYRMQNCFQVNGFKCGKRAGQAIGRARLTHLKENSETKQLRHTKIAITWKQGQTRYLFVSTFFILL